MTTPTKASRGRPRKKPDLARFDTPAIGSGEGEFPELAAAASLTVAILKHLGVDSVDTLYNKSLGEATQSTSHRFDRVFWRKYALLSVTEEQSALISKYLPVLRFLRTKPIIHIAVCPVCFRSADGGVPHGWQPVTGQPPSKCKVTLGCPGKPLKAPVPPKVYVPAEQDDETPDTEGP